MKIHCYEEREIAQDQSDFFFHMCDNYDTFFMCDDKTQDNEDTIDFEANDAYVTISTKMFILGKADRNGRADIINECWVMSFLRENREWKCHLWYCGPSK